MEFSSGAVVFVEMEMRVGLRGITHVDVVVRPDEPALLE